MSRKPTKKKRLPPSEDARPRPYHLQLGKVRHGLYVHRFDTEAKARAKALAVTNSLEADLKRWNPAGLGALDEMRKALELATWGPTPRALNVTVDEHTGQDLHFVIWRDQ